jgi:hypothetical protein
MLKITKNEIKFLMDIQIMQITEYSGVLHLHQSVTQVQKSLDSCNLTLINYFIHVRIIYQSVLVSTM